MKLVYVGDLTGDEVLALPVVSDTEVVLIKAGTVLKREYVSKIKELSIKYIYVEDKVMEDSKGESKDNVKNQSIQMVPLDTLKKVKLHIYKIEETKKDTEKIVQRVLERHIYKHNKDLRAVGEAADRILISVMSEPEIVNNITEIRNISVDMYAHCINVCALATIMALRLKMSEKQVHNVAIGAILHDIGLRYIQVPYINRSEADMDEKEVLEYKKHTIYGYSSLQDEQWISDTSKEIILLHHERIDGSGYPFSQKSDKLCSEVKLVSICDEFDSLISGIGNRKMKIYEAIEYIKVQAGNIFDNNIANKLLESIAVYPVGMTVIMSDGDKGMVVRQNKEVTDRPVVRMTYHTDGSPYSNIVEKDLMKYLTLFIIDTE